ncbi:phosphotransferase [Demequina salsinemoris]|uniref:phosphotransferase n=1 Tax=Demequina salsinemoris TaxID=577470 RepID=UPI0007844665|nr:phosphotransferase [Demequina salsinemoris]
MTLPSRVPPPGRGAPSWAARDQLVAAHLRFDAIDRDAAAHAAMLRGLGLTRVIWDRFDEDPGSRVTALDALRREGIALDGIWAPHPLPDLGEPEYASRFGIVPAGLRSLLDIATRRGLSPDIWAPIAFDPPGAPAPLSDRGHQVEVERAADHLTPLVRLAHTHRLCVVLTNHGGWAGEPRTMLDIVDALARRGLKNVGIGLQLHHAQHHAADLDETLTMLGDSLVAIVVSGVDAGAELSGRLVLPFGAGSRDRWVSHVLVDSGWNGRVVVHAVGHDDAGARLADSIEGLEWAVARVAGDRSPKPTQRIVEPTWPPGWAWRPDTDAQPASQSAPPRAPLPTPYGQPEPRRAVARTDAAASFVAGTHGKRPRQATPPTSPVNAAPPVPPTATPAAPSPASSTSSASPQGSRAPQAPLTRRPGLAAARSFLPRRRRSVVLAPRPGERIVLMAPAALLGPPTAPSPAAPTPAAAPTAPDTIDRSRIDSEAPDPYSGALHALLTHLESVGFTGAPRSFGWDDQGRHLVEFVPGTRLDDPAAPAGVLDPVRIGRFVRDMHDALEHFVPPVDAQWFEGIPSPGQDLVVHQDLVPSNLVLRADGTLAAIDWDAAAPGTRLWDLAHVAHSFAPLYSEDSDLRGSTERLRGIVDGYGLDEAERERLVPLLAQRSARMYDYLETMARTGVSPWTDLWQRGVGAVWRRDAAWIRAHEQDWRWALLADAVVR